MRYVILLSVLLAGGLAAPTVAALPASDTSLDDESIVSACYHSVWGDSACCVVYNPVYGSAKSTVQECMEFVKVILNSGGGGPPR